MSKKDNKSKSDINDQVSDDADKKGVNSRLNKNDHEKIDYKDKYLRALADYQNLLKRLAKEKKDFVDYANERLIDKLLDVLDDFERAIVESNDEGVMLIFKKLKNILRIEGVEKIKIDKNDEFNPELMECIEAEPGGKKIKVVQAGYRLRGKVIRATKVKVIK